MYCELPRSDELKARLEALYPKEKTEMDDLEILPVEQLSNKRLREAQAEASEDGVGDDGKILEPECPIKLFRGRVKEAQPAPKKQVAPVATDE